MNPVEFQAIVTDIGEQILAGAGLRPDPRAAVARVIDHTILKPEATGNDVGSSAARPASTVSPASASIPTGCRWWRRNCGVRRSRSAPWSASRSAPTHRNEGRGNGRRHPRRGPGDRHGDQRGRAAFGRHTTVRERYPGRGRGGPRSAARSSKSFWKPRCWTTSRKSAPVKLAKAAGADFVKTSTGFSTSRRHRARYRLMRARGRSRPGRESIGRHPHAGGRADHGRRRRHAHRRQRQCTRLSRPPLPEV